VNVINTSFNVFSAMPVFVDTTQTGVLCSSKYPQELCSSNLYDLHVFNLKHN